MIALAVFYSFARFLPSDNRITGKFGQFVRRMVCRHILKSSGKKFNVERGAYFARGDKIEIGDFSGIGVNCRLYGPIRIGNNVLMGPDVVILTQNHNFERLDIPIGKQGFSYPKPVVIGDDVWIGTRAIILPGVNIGSKAIIGAGSIVTHDVPDFGIVGGNPARVIRYRKNPDAG